MGAASVQVITRFGDSVLHVWSGPADPSIDMAALTDGAIESRSRPFSTTSNGLVAFGAPLPLGDRAVHAIGGVTFEVSFDAAPPPPPRFSRVGKAAIGAILSVILHAAFASSIASSDVQDSDDQAATQDRLEALRALAERGDTRAIPVRAGWSNDIAASLTEMPATPRVERHLEREPTQRLTRQSKTISPGRARSPFDGTFGEACGCVRERGISLGSIGTLGHRSPTAALEIPSTPARFLTGHDLHPVAPVEGHLDPNLIQRAIHASSGRFSMCLETARRENPEIAGRVSVHFVISTEGRVTGASVIESPTESLGGCVRSAFEGLSFPKPEGGVVGVTYPFVLERGG